MSQPTPPGRNPWNPETDPPPKNTKDDKLVDRWTRYFRLYTGVGVTSAERETLRNEVAQRWDYKDWLKCEEQRDHLMRNSPIIRFLLDELEKSGCAFSREHLKCLPCDATRSGGFSPKQGVQICYNRLISKGHMEDTIAHELIHAYDHCKFKMDLRNCYHHACTEIRAASLSGDCRFLREVRRGHLSFVKQHQVCVRRRATLALKANPNCNAPGVAEEAVNKVFQSCFTDTRPFDEIY
ncbi:Mitochondrial inner membrane protease atp23 [Dispira parvispora]|uniref:Mitochondrial inner membrane protease ATP23 n=1 Tax=Dispira parvispora TaxID=1520584 RepID=A0A9W8B0M5_9FUNG|nr:Mitochondrial inner membrane protease atp23 [Dispira parvispora]